MEQELRELGRGVDDINLDNIPMQRVDRCHWWRLPDVIIDSQGLEGWHRVPSEREWRGWRGHAAR